MTQQVRSMIKAGKLGDVLHVHGSYLQDWQLYSSSPIRPPNSSTGDKSGAVSYLGAAWSDLIQHVMGQRISRVFADARVFVSQQTRPISSLQDYGDSPLNEQGIESSNTPEDYATVMFETDQGAKGVFTIAQISAGHEDSLYFEVTGSLASVRWNSDTPNELWLGNRDDVNKKILSVYPSMIAPEAETKSRDNMYPPEVYFELWPNILKNVFAEMYKAVSTGQTDSSITNTYDSFHDGYRAALLVEAVMASIRQSTWVDVRAE
jgi:predicted dehydrogenase